MVHITQLLWTLPAVCCTCIHYDNNKTEIDKFYEIKIVFIIHQMFILGVVTVNINTIF